MGCDLGVDPILESMGICAVTISRMENLQQIVKHKHGEWLPFTLDVGSSPGFTAPSLNIFRERTGKNRPEEYFDYDFRTVSLNTRYGGADSSALYSEARPDVTFDAWGIGHWAGGAEGTYQKTYPPLENATGTPEIDAHPTPLIDAGNAAEETQVYHSRGYPVFGYSGSIYEWSWWLRGMQTFMMDLLAQPVLAEAIIRKVAWFTTGLALETARAGIDVLCFYDDAGMQSGLQIDPGLWRAFIKPRWQEVLEAVRRQYPDRIFFLHSCGKIDAIIPDIIETGFHILHPIQPECMDFRKVRQDYGNDIVLCAAISAQNLFPFGPPGDVRRWVRDIKEHCAPDNNALLCPSNLIQPETPWENIVAFVEEARA